MGVTAESQEKFALVVAAAVEGELVRLVNRADLELFALRGERGKIILKKKERKKERKQVLSDGTYGNDYCELTERDGLASARESSIASLRIKIGRARSSRVYIDARSRRERSRARKLTSKQSLPILFQAKMRGVSSSA